MPVCYADSDPTFQPIKRLILTLTKASPAVITTTFDHDYTSGIVLRLKIPEEYGMSQANDFLGEITVIESNTFTINLDTTGFDTFVAPDNPTTCPQTIPVGETGALLQASFRNVLGD